MGTHIGSRRAQRRLVEGVLLEVQDVEREGGVRDQPHTLWKTDISQFETDISQFETDISQSETP
jgi:hypothetical protein